MHKGQILTLDIIDLAFGGKGIAKVASDTNLFTIFVDGALPGQTVEAKISLKKRRHAEAKLIKVLKQSESEVETTYQSVPGAPWSKLPIATQKQYKQSQVTDLFRKFAETDIEPLFDQYLASPETWHYRNKMEYSFGPTEELQSEDGTWKHSGFGLGSKKRGQFWLVENLTKDSGLFDSDFENALPDFRNWTETIHPSAYNSRTGSGFWRSLLVRKSFHEEAFLVNVITSPCHPELDSGSTFEKKLIDYWQKALGSKLKGLYWTQSDDPGNPAAKYQQRELLSGSPTLTEKLHDLTFEISIDSFFQTNVSSAAKLYDLAVSYLKPGTKQVLDLFCGTGTISQIVARKYPDAQVFGVEIIEAAVKDAEANAKLNKLQNTTFVAADVNKWLREQAMTSKGPDLKKVVFLDPPRAGISPKALIKIIESAPPQIIYVSCNPATMARDTKTLLEAGYDLEKISLVDQFPHTSHVEVVGSFINN